MRTRVRYARNARARSPYWGIRKRANRHFVDSMAPATRLPDFTASDRAHPKAAMPTVSGANSAHSSRICTRDFLIWAGSGFVSEVTLSEWEIFLTRRLHWLWRSCSRLARIAPHPSRTWVGAPTLGFSVLLISYFDAASRVISGNVFRRKLLLRSLREPVPNLLGAPITHSVGDVSRGSPSSVRAT